MDAPTPTLAALQERLDYAFKNPALLEEALTHSSRLQDDRGAAQSNQRLEFLGDAVLQLIVTQSLFALFPNEREGGLSQRRSALTKGSFLAARARELGLDACLSLGASEEAAGGREKASALEDAFEALVGAIYLDSGLPAAQRVVLALYGDLAARLSGVEEKENPKGRLQEIVQPEHGNLALRYDVVATYGADHAREYEIAVFLLDRLLGKGRGTSKKLAEEAAAQAALATLAESGKEADLR
jgi:ribonuclease-3